MSGSCCFMAQPIYICLGHTGSWFMAQPIYIDAGLWLSLYILVWVMLVYGSAYIHWSGSCWYIAQPIYICLGHAGL